MNIYIIKLSVFLWFLWPCYYFVMVIIMLFCVNKTFVPVYYLYYLGNRLGNDSNKLHT